MSASALLALVWLAAGDKPPSREDARRGFDAPAAPRRVAPAERPDRAAPLAPDALDALDALHARARPAEPVTGVRGRLRPVPPSRRFVVWEGRDSYRVAVDADGSFRFRGLPAGRPLVLDFFFDHAAPLTFRVELDADGLRDVGTLTLQHGLLIQGAVHDDLGRPVGGARVGIHVDGWREMEDRFADTDVDGRFSFEHLPTGTCTVWARADGFARADLEDVPVDERRFYALEVGRCGRLAVRATDARGAPRPDVGLVAGSTTADVRVYLRTGPDGRDSVFAPPGVYRVELLDGAADSEPARATVHADMTTEVELR